MLIEENEVAETLCSAREGGVGGGKDREHPGRSIYSYGHAHRRLVDTHTHTHTAAFNVIDQSFILIKMSFLFNYDCAHLAVLVGWLVFCASFSPPGVIWL